MRSPLLPHLTFLGLSFGWTSWSATLRGSVVEDHSGHAVVSAELRIARKGVAQLVADLESDGDGRFEPVDLEDGDYCAAFVRLGFDGRNGSLRGVPKGGAPSPQRRGHSSAGAFRRAARWTSSRVESRRRSAARARTRRNRTRGFGPQPGCIRWIAAFDARPRADLTTRVRPL